MKPLIPFLLAVYFLVSCDMQKAGEEQEISFDPLQFVDPFIGADYHGHVFVGANVPFGAVQVGPSNFSRGWDWCSGYHYSDSLVRGFSQLHLSGTGIGDLGDVLVMPATGRRFIRAGRGNDISNGYASKYSHDREAVEAGYYRVFLERYGIEAEMTATERVAFYRYTFPESQESRIIVDLGEGIGWDIPAKTYMKQIDETTFVGYRSSKGWAKEHIEHFVLKLNKAVEGLDLLVDGEEIDSTEAEGMVVKGFLEFKTEGNEEVLMKVAMSPVSIEGAMKNLEAEVPDWDFEEVLTAAQDKWRKAISRIEVKTKDTVDLRVFYTAMYHHLIAPQLFSDVDGSYRGADGEIHDNPGHNTYTLFSLWDTYRSSHPLYTIVHPERVSDMVNSMLNIFDEQGKLPVWHLRGSETNTMVGYSGIPVVVDAVLKGFEGIDAERAYNAVKTTATGDFEPGIQELMEKGYISADTVNETVASALEYAISDWAVAQIAGKLGKEEDYEEFMKRAHGFKSYFDQETGFFRGKFLSGEFREPFDPVQALHRKNDYCEGNAWQYLWLTPQAPEELISLLGGDEAFIDKLDELFSISSELEKGASVDISGLIGQYAHGNEPSHATTYLYTYAGEQYKTAEKVHYILNNLYTDQMDGISGNEDCGAMSAWYIMSSMGFYSVNPSSGMYVFGSPLFETATIHLENGKNFTIIANDLSDDNIYIQSVSLNGVDHVKSFITHKEIVAGGELVFQMGSEPNAEFGKAPENRPASKVY